MICPLCHSSKTKYQFTTNDFHGRYSYSKTNFKYFQCQSCLSIFPDITNIKLSDFYTQNYRTPSNILEKLLIKVNFLQHLLLLKILFKNKNISVLDVGCGTGEYLQFLPNNYKKTGIDIKIDSQNPNLIEADFLQYKFKNKFDLINFSHSLEHITNPMIAINKAKSLLNQNGAITISLPVTDSYSFTINPRKAFHLDPPRHIFIPNSYKFKSILSPLFSQVFTISFPFEFPLDLFWTIKNSQQKYLMSIFPLLKILKSETKLFICRR